MRKPFFSCFLSGMLVVWGAQQAVAAPARPVVLELFTSQGCSSCPAADALLKEFASDPTTLPLSLHVDYWDYLGWKDPLSSPAMTARQRAYAAALGRNNVFTPELVVNGQFSVVGSNRASVESAIAKAQASQQSVTLQLVPDSSGKNLLLTLDITDKAMFAHTGFTAFYFRSNISTDVKNGENGGRTLTHINNVTRIQELGESRAIPMPTGNEDGVAVLLQKNGNGPIIGAARYLR